MGFSFIIDLWVIFMFGDYIWDRDYIILVMFLFSFLGVLFGVMGLYYHCDVFVLYDIGCDFICVFLDPNVCDYIILIL